MAASSSSSSSSSSFADATNSAGERREHSSLGSSSSSSSSTVLPTECSVCWETFDKTLIRVTCPQCFVTTCDVCMFSFIEGKSIMPSCSKTECGFVYDEAFLSSVLPEDMRTEIRDLVKRVLVDQEKARLPEVMAEINENGSPLMRPRVRLPNREIRTKLKDEICRLRFEVRYRELVVEVLTRMNSGSVFWTFDEKKKVYHIHVGISSGGHYVDSGAILYTSGMPRLRDNKGRYIFTDEEKKEVDRFFFAKVKRTDLPVYIQKLKDEIGDKDRIIEAKLVEHQSLAGKSYVDYRGNPISVEEYNEYMRQESWRRQLEASNQTPGEPAKVNTERRGFVMPCGREGCAGFLSTRWKCMRCDGHRCRECHVNLDDDTKDEHECNPDDVATAKTIMTETKACPKCGTRIQRSHGCDHMWCTECNTSFLYSTGCAIPDSQNTNPHYHMWRQSQGRGGTIAQNVCPEDASFIPESTLSCLMFGLGLAVYEVAMALELRILVEPRLPVRRGERQQTTGLPLDESMEEDKAETRRQEFALGLITEDQLRNRLFLSYRRNERKKHHNNIVRMVRAAGTQILTDIMASTTIKQARRHLRGIPELLRFANEAYLRINTQLLYDSTPIINKYFEYIPLVKVTQATTMEQCRKYGRPAYHQNLSSFCAWSHILGLRDLPDPETRSRVITSSFMPGDVIYRSGMSKLTDTDFDYTIGMPDIRPRPVAKAPVKRTSRRKAPIKTTQRNSKSSNRKSKAQSSEDEVDIDALLNEIDFYIAD